MLLRRLLLCAWLALVVGSCSVAPGPPRPAAAPALELPDGAPAFALDRSALEAREEELLVHDAPGFGSYLAMTVPYPPVATLRREVDRHLGIELKSRGEAHITVVTPPEFNGSLKPFLPIERIHEIARAGRIQEARYTPLCVGRGLAPGAGAELATYFIVVRSPDLEALRQAIAAEAEAAAGGETGFAPESFYPHVTVGFTVRDLHESDGVIKDESSCWARLHVMDPEVEGMGPLGEKLP